MNEWAERAAAAERAVVDRHMARLWMLPGTALARTGWPPTFQQRMHVYWYYWWQAHLMECLLDAELREPSAARSKLVRRLARGIWVRHTFRWTNINYDDMAWLGIALQRASDITGLDTRRAVGELTSRLREGWTEHAGGGIWWRVGDNFKNTPSNGPAAILLARTGDHEWSRRAAEWITERLVSPESGLVWDGLRVDLESGEVYEVAKQIYTYCQGVYIGACVELASVDRSGIWTERAAGAIGAVSRRLATGGVLRGHDGHDGGLFTGVLVRYLALAALRLPDGDAPRLARDLVLNSAQSCWENAVEAEGGPVFGPNWLKPAEVPVKSVKIDETDLSVQLSGWMLMEAAAALSEPQPFWTGP